jgi:hypothetical protein
MHRAQPGGRLIASRSRPFHAALVAVTRLAVNRAR